MKITFSTFWSVVMWSVVMWSAPLARAATYYVATTGNDSADGSIGTPWLRITNSLPKIAGGDTLNIRAGTYGEWIANTIPSGASWATATVLQAYNGELVILNPATPDIGSDIIRIVGTNKHHIIVNGLIIDGINLTNGANCVKGTYSVDGQPSQYIRFSNCSISNAFDAMNVLLTANGNYTPTYWEFTNCIIAYAARTSGDDTPAKHGIYVSTSSNTFDRCTVFGNQSLGFHFYDGLPSGNIIRNCIFPGVGATNQAIGLYGGTNNQIYNNVFYDNYVGILVKPLQAADDTLIAFNTFYSNGVSLQVFNADAILGDVTIQNNIFSESSLTNYGAVHLTPGVGTNSTVTVRNNVMQGEGLPGRVFMDVDTAATFADNLTNRFLAGFVNPIARDFTLQSGGPAVSAGIATSGITNDFAGVTRGSPPDLGAYEFIAGVVSSDIPGTIVAAKITSGNTVNTFSIGDSDEMKGTPKTVSFLSQLDLIPAERRTEGMEAWVLETRKAYRLVGGTNNSNWEPLALTEGGVLTAAGANTELQYNSDGVISGATGLVWNATTGFFGVGTNNPQARLHIAGDIVADGYGSSGRLTVTRDGGYPVYLSSGNSQSSRLHTQNGFWIEEEDGQKMLHYNTVDAQPIISFNYNSNNYDTEIKGQTNVLFYADASAGLVGIGTTNPAYQLHVVGTNRADYFVGDGSLLTGIAGGGSVQTNISYTSITNAPGSTTQLIFNDGGVFGADAGLTYNKTTDALSVSGRTGIGMAAGTPGLSVAGPSGGVSLSLSDLVNSTMTVSHPVGGAIRLQTGGGSSAFEFYTSNEKMRLTGAGRLGIGNPSPSHQLDVAGNGRVLNDGTDASFYITAGPSSFSILNLGDTDNNGIAQVRYDNANNRMEFTVNNVVQQMVINSSGNVGIGTNAPFTKLHVVGNQVTTGTNQAAYFVGNGSLLTGIASAAQTNISYLAVTNAPWVTNVTASGGATSSTSDGGHSFNIDVTGGGGSITNFGVTGSGANTATTNGTVVDIFTSGLDPRFTSSAGTITSGSNTFAATTIVGTKIFADELNATNASSLTMTAAGQTLTLGSGGLTLSGSGAGYIGPVGNATIDASGFNGVLATSDNTIQEALQKLDDLSVGGSSVQTNISYTAVTNEPWAESATTITIAGTANEITSSAGAQDLSANRTWTLSLPTGINATKIADGSVSSAEFQFIGGLTSDAQTQITAKLPLAGGILSGQVTSSSSIVATNGFLVPTNGMGNAVVDFNKPDVSTNCAAAITFTGITNFKQGVANQAIIHLLATGTHTITFPAEWKDAFAGGTTYTTTNGVQTDLLITCQVGLYTNITKLDYY